MALFLLFVALVRDADVLVRKPANVCVNFCAMGSWSSPTAGFERSRGMAGDPKILHEMDFQKLKCFTRRSSS